MCDHINCLSSCNETDGQRRWFVGVTCGRSHSPQSVPTTHLQEQPHPLIQQPRPNPHSVTARTAWMEEPTLEATVSVFQGTVGCTVKWPSTHPLVRMRRPTGYMHGRCSEQCCMYERILPHPLFFTLSPLSPCSPPSPHPPSCTHLPDRLGLSLWRMLQWHLWLCLGILCLPPSLWRGALWPSHKWVILVG